MDKERLDTLFAEYSTKKTLFFEQVEIARASLMKVQYPTTKFAAARTTFIVYFMEPFRDFKRYTHIDGPWAMGELLIRTVKENHYVEIITNLVTANEITSSTLDKVQNVYVTVLRLVELYKMLYVREDKTFFSEKVLSNVGAILGSFHHDNQ